MHPYTNHHSCNYYVLALWHMVGVPLNLGQVSSALNMDYMATVVVALCHMVGVPLNLGQMSSALNMDHMATVVVVET